MFTAEFWKAAAERAIKTFAQVLTATLVGAGTGLLNTDWKGALSVAGMATLLSFLTSVASGGISGGGPSLTNSEKLAVDPPPPPAA